ncbi:MAG: hypothetical protein ACXAEF_00540 [Candidatus Thorarchaeota archaeon]|jgi:hypothetical protein
MSANRNYAIAAFAMFLLGLGMPLVAAQSNSIQYQQSAGIVTLTTDDIDIRVTGANQAPHFHWWDPNNPTVDYHVMFPKMFEANDTNTNGVFDVGTDIMIGTPFALPTTNWDFSGFDVETDGENTTAIHFNFTTSSTYDPRGSDSGSQSGNIPDLDEFDVYIEIRVHLDMTSPGEFKFDVIIDGWEWTYDDSILVMQFTITESAHGQQGVSDDAPSGFQHTGTQFDFANGYMQYEETALAAQNQIEVKASYGEGTGLEAGQNVYLAFEYFGDETLVYDPVIGITSSDAISSDTLLLVAGGAIILLVVVLVLWKLKR